MNEQQKAIIKDAEEREQEILKCAVLDHSEIPKAEQIRQLRAERDRMLKEAE